MAVAHLDEVRRLGATGSRVQGAAKWGENEHFELKSLIFCAQQILNYQSFIYSPTDALVSCLKKRY